jgi:uncharacterized protein YfaT (DUF1175 family)
MANAERRTVIAGLSLLAAAALVPFPLAFSATDIEAATSTTPSTAPTSTLRPATPISALDPEQSRRFRAWFVLIVSDQLRRGPNPRWYHRDCAGLVRFAIGETLRPHDYAWRRANGLLSTRLPPEIALSAAQQQWRDQWRRPDGSQGAFVTASALVQSNSVLVSRDINLAEPGDLLFFDQGDDQHLMIWMGNYIAYHNGNRRQGDSGLRAVGVQQLLSWSDVRWQPRIDNPNFFGVFRPWFVSR